MINVHPLYKASSATNIVNKIYIFIFLLGFCTFSVAKEESSFDLSGKMASFEKAHQAIQTSCMPCHSAQLPLPWYGRMPGIKQQMKKNYLKAIEGLNLDSQIYVTGQPPSAEALGKIEEVLQKDRMPPRLYRLKHLESRLSQQEKWAILNWIRDERVGAQRLMQLPPPPQAAPAPVSEKKAEKNNNPFKPFDS